MHRDYKDSTISFESEGCYRTPTESKRRTWEYFFHGLLIRLKDFYRHAKGGFPPRKLYQTSQSEVLLDYDVCAIR